MDGADGCRIQFGCRVGMAAVVEGFAGLLAELGGCQLREGGEDDLGGFVGTTELLGQDLCEPGGLAGTCAGVDILNVFHTSLPFRMG